MQHLTSLAALFLLLLPCALVAQEATSSGAKLFIEETTFDFGYVPAGAVVSHSYILHNRGSDLLKILKVQPGCGCTKAPLKKEEVAVGDSADIELVFTSSKGGRGTFSKSTTVTCNDNDRPNFQLVFKGSTFDNPKSLYPLLISQAEITWDASTRSKEAKVAVENVSANGVKLQLVSFPSGYLKVDLPDSEIKPGKQKEIKVKIERSVTEGQFKKSFTFAVNDSAGSRYTIPVALAQAVDVTKIQPAPKKKVEGSR